MRIQKNHNIDKKHPGVIFFMRKSLITPILVAFVSLTRFGFAEQDIDLVKERENGVYHISIQNNSDASYIVRVDAEMQNMQSSMPLPVDVIVPARSTTYTCRISRIDSTKPGSYNMQYIPRLETIVMQNCKAADFCIITHIVRDSVTFYLENKLTIPVTVSFESDFKNVVSAQSTSVVRSFAANSRAPFLAARLVDPFAPRKTSYHYKWKRGALDVQHDDAYAYMLPFERGQSFVISQGPNGASTHRGEFAYDWSMPVGTTIRAARGGIVTRVVENFSEGGQQESFAKMGNIVEIMHSDNSFGRYCHIEKDGVLVETGERITRGHVIALSGNTGYSSGPHLHFDVVKLEPDLTFKTLPIRFKVSRKKVTDLQQGDRYAAFE